MIISISGMPGSGKTTNAKYLAEALGYEFYSMGNMRREMARRRGLTIKELNTIGETQQFTDAEVDEFQKELGRTCDNFIVDGWMSFYFIPQSFKIFLNCDLAVGAERIWQQLRADPDTRNEGRNLDSAEAVAADLRIRIDSSQRRYLKYYGVDYLELDQYDVVVDTNQLTPAEVSQRLLAEIKKHVVAAK